MDEITAKKRIHRLVKTGLISERREGLGLSQSDLGRALGVNQSAVSRWESGDARPTGEHARALVRLGDRMTPQELEAAVLTVPEAAKLLGVSPRTYYAAAKRGEVPSVSVGRRIVVPGAALARLLAAGGGANGTGKRDPR